VRELCVEIRLRRRANREADAHAPFTNRAMAKKSKIEI